MPPKLKAWITALTYVLFIYMTLSSVVAPLKFLRSHGVLRLTLGAVYGSAFLWLLIKLLQTPSHRVARAAVLVAVFGLYGLITLKVTTPEEQFHFLEYGLVGVLFARALREHGIRRIGVFVGALVLASAAGALDESLQGLLPNRHFDVHDIWLNVVSAALGLSIYLSFPDRRLTTST